MDGDDLCLVEMKNSQNLGNELVDGFDSFQALHPSLNSCHILGFQQKRVAFVLCLHLIPSAGMPPLLSAAHLPRGVIATPAAGLESSALLLSPLHEEVFSQDPLIVGLLLLNSEPKRGMKYYFDTEAR